MPRALRGRSSSTTTWYALQTQDTNRMNTLQRAKQAQAEHGWQCSRFSVLPVNIKTVKKKLKKNPKYLFMNGTEMHAESSKSQSTPSL